MRGGGIIQYFFFTCHYICKLVEIIIIRRFRDTALYLYLYLYLSLPHHINFPLHQWNSYSTVIQFFFCVRVCVYVCVSYR
ncbi:hypothetical protein HOY80DRAFT_950384 [Tuber brumale]|nr:hypothetical protein HOY80DRAFT_950384 [Tuber brumale]